MTFMTTTNMSTGRKTKVRICLWDHTLSCWVLSPLMFPMTYKKHESLVRDLHEELYSNMVNENSSSLTRDSLSHPNRLLLNNVALTILEPYRSYMDNSRSQTPPGCGGTVGMWNTPRQSLNELLLKQKDGILRNLTKFCVWLCSLR